MSAERKKGLGRGLGALIGSTPSLTAGVNSASQSLEVLSLPIEQIKPNTNQPRKSFNMEKLVELAESIKTNGVIQPIIVSQIDGSPDNYMVVAGERRLRASKLAGKNNVPALVRKLSDAEILEQSIIENIQRENLNPIEEALAFKQLLDKLGFTQEQLAKRLGKSRSAVANAMRMLNLPEDIKESLAEGRISAGHARALLSLDDAGRMTSLKNRIIEEGMSVREAEDATKEAKPLLKLSTSELKLPPHVDKGGKQPQKPSLSKRAGNDISAEIENISRILSDNLSAQVSIKQNKDGGKIEIHFSDFQELSRLYSLIIKN